MYPKVQRGKQSTIKKLKKYCHRYPHIPHFKNYLEAACQQTDKMKRAVELNRRTIEEHPNYLFGKINYANIILIEESEARKVPEVLEEELDLKALYPQRDTCHIREVLAFYLACIRYYLAVDNQDKAEECLTLMNDAGPGEPETKEASFHCTSAMMEGAARRIEEENKRCP